MVCLNCGKEFIPKTKRNKFCSTPCRKTHTYPKVCDECGKMFSAVYAKTRFCSTRCGSRNTHRNAYKMVICTVCGVEYCFKGTTVPKYCSDCRKKKNVELIMRNRVTRGMQNSDSIGVGRGGWQKQGDNATTRSVQGIHQIEKAYFDSCLTRFGNVSCVVCKDTESVQVHHIDHDPMNNVPENLVFLCRPCHVRHHKKKALTTEHILNCIFEALKPHSYRC